MRSIYRAALDGDKGSFNIGICLVRNAVSGIGSVTSAAIEHTESRGGKVLIAFFSWGGNTKGIAEEIQAQTDAEMSEALSVHYSGGSDLPVEITEWLETNGIIE